MASNKLQGLMKTNLLRREVAAGLDPKTRRMIWKPRWEVTAGFDDEQAALAYREALEKRIPNKTNPRDPEGRRGLD